MFATGSSEDSAQATTELPLTRIYTTENACEVIPKADGCGAVMRISVIWWIGIDDVD